MFASALIVFRESLEAAIIIGILAATTKDVQKSKRWIGLGILSGILASFIIAGLIDIIANLAQGNGQEVMKIIALAVAIVMLSWHQIVTSSHGKDIAINTKSIGEKVRQGDKTMFAIAVTIFFTVLREGSETVLFLYGAMLSSKMTTLDLIGGTIIGLSGGILSGLIIYAGLLKISVKKIFAVTNILLLFLAAGMASQLALFSIQIDWLPSLATPIWDTSAFLSDNSAFGVTLHILMGYTAQPAGMQVVFYLAMMAIIVLSTKFYKRFN